MQLTAAAQTIEVLSRLLEGGAVEAGLSQATNGLASEFAKTVRCLGALAEAAAERLANPTKACQDLEAALRRLRALEREIPSNMAQLARQTAGAQERVAIVQSEHVGIASQLRDLTERAEALERENRAAKDEVRGLQSRVDAARSESDVLSGRRESLLRDLAESGARRDQLRLALEALRNDPRERVRTAVVAALRELGPDSTERKGADHR